METLYITHPACKLHEMGDWHPECPARLDAIHDQLVASGLLDFLDEAEAPVAAEADLLRVHTAAHLDYLRSHAPKQGYFPIDADTIMNPHTLEAAAVAAGAGIAAVDAVLGGSHQTAFCAVRPPGHHARPAQAMGFCFYNNLAVAAAYALDSHGLSRVAIVDFDVHHGNGTEDMFAGDDRVLMCSFFQNSIFPGTWRRPCPENMVNIPVDAYTRGDELRQVVSDLWMPRLRAFSPELVLISAGFDGHREDDMGQLGLVEADFSWITQQVVALAGQTAGGRVVSFLEGGYALSALGRSAVAHIRALASL
ncbi:histone deacetylase family protein [Allopusillimonas soli]|uniref:Histone deacetylase family protein n=1 Tax=Allopusillimonas soli TaxID=659016 RepID=A0A853F9L4_9BURK|nr:histone deacetylase family protein [Allopusillimonas soli]NYT35291.1 histone deacetylase family protein [Allopusillimonas soli]TEA75714.1 histone deacetylase family protein [Allopusillimonas soli]